MIVNERIGNLHVVRRKGRKIRVRAANGRIGKWQVIPTVDVASLVAANSRDTLVAMASARGVKVRSKATKAELAALLV